MKERGGPIFLPRRTRGGADLLDAHATRCRREGCKDAVAIVKEVARRLVLGKGLAELLRSPEGGRMCGDGDVHERRTLASLKQLDS
jgi:hypothetical protein